MRQRLIYLCKIHLPLRLWCQPIVGDAEGCRPIMGWAPCRAWPPLGVVCPACFGLPAYNGTVRESQSLMDLAKSNKGGIVTLSILFRSREQLKHVRKTSPSVILGDGASKANGLVSLASDARQVRYIISSLIDSLSKVGGGRLHKKYLRRRRRQHPHEMRQIVRSLGLGIGASQHNVVLSVIVPDHVY